MVIKCDILALKGTNLPRVKSEDPDMRRGSPISRTSMARTYLGPWKFVRDMGSPSQ